MNKRTPLFEIHQGLGARTIEFGDWEMPVQYSSIIDEHHAVRKASGLFDISHMGEFFVSGPKAEDFLNHALTNDIRKLAVGEGQYTMMCNERGGVIDDLYVYRLGQQDYLLIVNASRISEDFANLTARLEGSDDSNAVQLKDESDSHGALAVQGPRVCEFIDQCFNGPATAGTPVAKPSDLAKNQIAQFQFETNSAWVSRTGYSGEDGFEIVCASDRVASVWDRTLAVGHRGGLQPAGLGARDTLRTEMGYPLYGHELNENITPIEAGLGFFVALDKGDFVGRSVLAEQKQGGVSKRCVAFKMTEKSAPPRPGYPIWSGGEYPQKIGEVVSGTQSPSLACGIGMGYVPREFAGADNTISIEIRGKRIPAVIVKKPIYRKPKKP